MLGSPWRWLLGPFRWVVFLLAMPANGLTVIVCLYVGLTLSVVVDRALAALVAFPIYRALAIGGVVPIMAFYASVPVTRALTRFVPPAVRRVRWGCLVILGCLAFFIGGEPLLDNELRGQLLHRAAWAEHDRVGKSFLWAFFACVLVLVAFQHMRRDWQVPSSYVLYLRRFGSFADRAVIGYVLRLLQPGVSMLLLRPPTSGVGDWDPVTIGFAGFKLRKPLRSMPLFLRSKDASWVEDVHSLVKHANCIILDVSDLSPAVQTELDLVQRVGAEPRTLFIAERSSHSGSCVLGRPVLHYRRSAWAGWRRIVTTALFLLAAVLLDANLDRVLPYIEAYVRWLDVPTSDEVLRGGSWTFLVPLTWSVLLRRSLDHESKRQLRMEVERLCGGRRSPKYHPETPSDSGSR